MWRTSVDVAHDFSRAETACEEVRVRVRVLTGAALAAVLALALTPRTTTALGRPGVTPAPCPAQTWQMGDPAFEALPGAKAFFGQYEGGIYKIEIPDNWNGELVLYAHGFVSNAGAQGSTGTSMGAPRGCTRGPNPPATRSTAT